MAKRNKSMKGWLLQKTNPLQLSSVQEEDEAMEVDEMSMRELDVGVDHAKGQRLAKCKARQTEHLNKAICASLVDELFTGVGSKAGVRLCEGVADPG